MPTVYPFFIWCKKFLVSWIIQSNKSTKTIVETKTRPPRFLLQMREDLRHDLEKAAISNGRTLTAEINTRLRESFKNLPAPSERAATKGTSYAAPTIASVFHINEKSPASTLSSTDQAMLEIFRALPVEKQLALLSLFR